MPTKQAIQPHMGSPRIDSGAPPHDSTTLLARQSIRGHAARRRPGRSERAGCTSPAVESAPVVESAAIVVPAIAVVLAAVVLAVVVLAFLILAAVVVALVVLALAVVVAAKEPVAAEQVAQRFGRQDAAADAEGDLACPARKPWPPDRCQPDGCWYCGA